MDEFIILASEMIAWAISSSDPVVEFVGGGCESVTGTLSVISALSESSPDRRGSGFGEYEGETAGEEDEEDSEEDVEDFEDCEDCEECKGESCGEVGWEIRS